MTYSDSKWAERLNYLATIEDGWYEGYGEALTSGVLDKADEILHSLDSPNFHVPGLFPLVEGSGIGMEWSEIGQSGQVNLEFRQVTFEFTKDFSYVVFAMDNTESPADDVFVETDSFEEAMTTLRECLTASRLLTKCVTRD